MPLIVIPFAQRARLGVRLFDGYFVRSISVAFCSAKVAIRGATFSERKATITDSQSRSGVSQKIPQGHGRFVGGVEFLAQNAFAHGERFAPIA